MKLRICDYRDALAIINSTNQEGALVHPKLYERYYEFIDALESITEEEIIAQFNYEKSQKATVSFKSLASPINALIRKHLSIYPEWKAESFLFNEPEYRKAKQKGDKNHTEWRLDFASEDALAVEVAFNHGEAIAWNLAKLQISAELNHVQKAINTNIGIYVCVTDEMKIAGNFDGAVGSFEKVQRYFTPMRNILTAPIVLIGLEAPETFQISKETREVYDLYNNHNYQSCYQDT